ncbi:hypothetical protein [Streptomyces sp. NBC_01451]|uniref:hypothetical protein n=1 Tax=Streptomyces sp. NBC_01451 TaxID=2903872 RepID=UPI002E3776D5|nr:hypothetical protein [Streptomyces sp. NBC_01451]
MGGGGDGATENDNQGDPDLSALSFHYGGGALADAKDWVASLMRDGHSITGVSRSYNAKIDVFDSVSAGVVHCEDQSNAFAKDRKSKKVYKTEVNDDSYVIYRTRPGATSAAIQPVSNRTPPACWYESRSVAEFSDYVETMHNETINTPGQANYAKAAVGQSRNF